MNHDQTDTRATAYVFGELLPEDAVAFERELEQSPKLRRDVDALRETIGALKSEFDANSTDLDASHRGVIDRAILHSGDASSMRTVEDNTPTPPPVVLRTQRGPSRHWLVIACLAASVLLLFGLMYPYLRDPGANTIATQYESSDQLANEIRQQVQSFNGAIQERRYEDAEEIAKQYSSANPDDPLASTMLQTSEMGKRLVANEAAFAAIPNLDPAIFPSLGAAAEDAEIAMELMDSDEEMAAVTVPTDDSLLIMSDDLQVALSESDLPQIVELDLEGLDVAATQLTNPVNKLSQLSVRSNAAEVSGEMNYAGRNAQPGDRDFGFKASSQTFGDGVQALPGPQVESKQPRRSRRFRDQDSDGAADLAYTGGEDSMEMMMGGMMMGGMEEMEMLEDEMGMDAMMGMGMMGPEMSGDRFEPIEDNAFVSVSQGPLSTFSIDVDTASYAKVRSMLNRNSLPRPDSVRIEELLNYFHYDYPAPQDDHPFAASMEIASCPWNPEHRLARVGIKGREIETDRPSSNLVFLLDVSGSMDEPNKLPLMVDGMKMLTDQLSENDKVAIVVYAGAAGLVLDSTRGDKKQEIVAALERLKAGGSTNGGQGIALAYDVARDNFVVGGTNRVLLCSDGDFNVGVTGTDALVELAKENAKSNVFLSILGFGSGNHNDSMMERVSNDANGNYAYIDSISEAKKILVEELGGTLVAIAKDVKIQIEFNPKEVESYRLIGYENRVLAAEDFNNDKIDAGEIGAGHTVTALYEVVPKVKQERKDAAKIDPLRYQTPAMLNDIADAGEMLALKLRYKEPDGDTSTLIQFPVSDSGRSFQQTDRDFKFAASVASFGMLLRHSPYSGTATMDDVLNMAREGTVGDDYGYRTEFLALVERAHQLSGR
ncbi:MAG: YfbK domain-containing protein [Rubripirellula sp.]